MTETRFRSYDHDFCTLVNTVQIDLDDRPEPSYES